MNIDFQPEQRALVTSYACLPSPSTSIDSSSSGSNEKKSMKAWGRPLTRSDTQMERCNELKLLLLAVDGGEWSDKRGGSPGALKK